MPGWNLSKMKKTLCWTKKVPPLDRLAAQILSIVAIGQVMLDGELGVRGAQAGAELIARLQGQAARAARA